MITRIFPPTGLLALAAIFVTFASTTLRFAAADEQLPVAPLSVQELEILFSAVAFYPDKVIENIMVASQNPQAIDAYLKQGKAAFPNEQAPEFLIILSPYPDLLKEMQAHPEWTGRFALAARTQLGDVWTAIDRVRAAAQAAQQPAEQPVVEGYVEGGSTSSGSTGAGGAYVYPYAGFVAGAAWAKAVDNWYDAYHLTAGQTTVYGPHGNSATVTGGAYKAAETSGNTTEFQAGAAGNVTTSNGGDYSAAGRVEGSVTDTGAGHTFEKTSSGGVVNNNTGAYGEATRSTNGYANQNADGSTSFGRNAATSTQSSYGASQIQHSGSGVYTGNGNGSYTGSTSVDSTHGNASVETQAGNGQASTTVQTQNGSQTFTAGDGQVNGQTPPSTQRATNANSQSPSTTSGFSRQQAGAASNPATSNRATGNFIPGSGLPNGSFNPGANRSPTTPSFSGSNRSGFSTPNRGGGGGGGRSRGRR